MDGSDGWSEEHAGDNTDLLAGFDIYGNVASSTSPESGDSPLSGSSDASGEQWGAMMDFEDTESTSSDGFLGDDLSEGYHSEDSIARSEPFSEPDMKSEPFGDYSDYEIPPELLLSSTVESTMRNGGGTMFPNPGEGWSNREEGGMAEQRWQAAQPPSGGERPLVRPSSPAEQQKPVAVPSPSHPPGEAPPISAEPGGAGGACVCPLCARTCQQPHRLGMYWRKFGYKGKACTRGLASRRASRIISNTTCALLAQGLLTATAARACSAPTF
jgi:hypothetical protein